VWRGAEFDSSDFHDFWSASSLYQSIRDEGLRSMTGFMHITPDMTLARESWTRDRGGAAHRRRRAGVRLRCRRVSAMLARRAADPASPGRCAMKRPWLTKLCVVVIGLGAGTCGPESAGPAAEMRCRDSAGLAAENADALCPCYVADGIFTDEQSCVEAFTVDDSYYDCICPIYGKYPEVNAYLDCLEPAQTRMMACITASGCDDEQRDACNEAFIGDIMACAPPSDAFLDELATKCGEPVP
jgi:hypothetical protein